MKEIEEAIVRGEYLCSGIELTPEQWKAVMKSLTVTAKHAYDKGFEDCSLNCDTHVKEAEAKGRADYMQELLNTINKLKEEEHSMKDIGIAIQVGLMVDLDEQEDGRV